MTRQASVTLWTERADGPGEAANRTMSRAFASARKRWTESTVPEHLVAEVADCTALTIVNPLTIIY